MIVNSSALAVQTGIGDPSASLGTTDQEGINIDAFAFQLRQHFIQIFDPQVDRERLFCSARNNQC
jgi:hypothetical protein